MRSFIALFLLACLVTSCDDAVIDPFNNDGRYYTIYGFLDALERNHEVRVIPVTRRGEKITNPNNPESQLDASVRSIDLLSGQTTTWRHSLEELEDGTYAHIFRATFLVTAGATYRLEVERSDGVVAYAETTVPLINTASLFEKGPVVFSADSSIVTQEIFIPTVDSPWDIQAVYLWAAGPINRRIFVPYGRRGSRGPNGGWNLTVQISEDQIPVMENVEQSRIQDFENPNIPVILSAMGVQVRVLDENWDPPEGEFDPEILANPNSLTNVVNGYGFWGSVGLYREEWNMCELSGALGYTPSVAGC
ncbi:MAG: hypothetical protein AAF564_12885 [Bacteroidota bacterium]